MNWNWQIIIDSIPKLLQGSIITIELVVLSGLLGFMLAVPLALARLSKKPWVQALPFAYNKLFVLTLPAVTLPVTTKEPVTFDVAIVVFGTYRYEAVLIVITGPRLATALLAVVNAAAILALAVLRPPCKYTEFADAEFA